MNIDKSPTSDYFSLFTLAKEVWWHANIGQYTPLGNEVGRKKYLLSLWLITKPFYVHLGWNYAKGGEGGACGGRGGGQGCVRGLKGTKGSFSVIKEDPLQTHPLFSGGRFLFFLRKREWRLQGGIYGGRVWWLWWGRKGGSADFKVIFNFKPCSLSEMKPPCPRHTVLSMVPSGSLPPLLSSQAFVTVAFKWHYSPAGWPSEGVPLRRPERDRL